MGFRVGGDQRGSTVFRVGVSLARLVEIISARARRDHLGAGLVEIISARARVLDFGGYGLAGGANG